VIAGCAQRAGAQEAAASRPRRAAAEQPLDGPNVTTDRDMAVGSLVDSFFAPLTSDARPVRGATRALGGQPSKASIRPQWTARLARNPKSGDGNPPYVLIDKYGGIQRYVEPVPQIDLEKHVGQTVSVRRDTGHTLLANQLELPAASTSAKAAAVASTKQKNDGVNLAAFQQPAASKAAASPTPTPADGPPMPTAETQLLPSPQGEVIEGTPILGDGPMLDANGQPMVVPEGVDPLYLNDDGDLPMHGCPNCGSKLCAMQGGCGFGSRPIFYARGEYLLWWIQGMQIPPLVVEGTSDNGDFVDAFVVYGNQQILKDSRSGGRVRLGYWLDDYGRYAIEGEYLTLGEISEHFQDGGDGTSRIVGRPFINVLTGDPNVEDVSNRGIRGTVDVNATSQFQSAGVWLRRNLCCSPGCASCGDPVTCGSSVCGPMGCGSGVGEPPCLQIFKGGTRHVDVVYGIRWAQLNEGLTITENLEVIAPSPPSSIGTTFLVNDQFSTGNQFIGGEFGFMWDWQKNRWSLELLSKLALGNTHQSVNISGFTVNTPPGGTPETFTGGLLTQTSNIGHYERDVFSVLPQLGVNAGYMLTDRLKLIGGYTFMYWSRVARPGDQIDLEVNPNLIPGGGGGGPDRPQFVFRDTSIWIQGVNLGLEYQW
jgi:hypothetical protein